MREPLCVVARRRHSLAARRKLRLRDLGATPWILQPPGSAVRQSIDTLFTREGMSPGPALIETVSIVATLALLQALDGVSVLPLDLARYYEEQGLLVRLALKLPGGTDYALMLRTDRELSPAALDFTRAVRKLAAASRVRPMRATHG